MGSGTCTASNPLAISIQRAMPAAWRCLPPSRCGRSRARSGTPRKWRPARICARPCRGGSARRVPCKRRHSSARRPRHRYALDEAHHHDARTPCKRLPVTIPPRRRRARQCLRVRVKPGDRDNPRRRGPRISPWKSSTVELALLATPPLSALIDSSPAPHRQGAHPFHRPAHAIPRLSRIRLIHAVIRRSATMPMKAMTSPATMPRPASAFDSALKTPDPNRAYPPWRR